MAGGLQAIPLPWPICLPPLPVIFSRKQPSPTRAPRCAAPEAENPRQESTGQIERKQVLGGLISEYGRAAQPFPSAQTTQA